MATIANTVVSPAEYLEFERNSERKHEYRDGEIVEMVGGTREHSLILGNLMWILGGTLREKDYEYFQSEMRVKVSETGLYTYPDVVVVRGSSRLEDDHVDTLLNPTVIFEVLSPSAESYDRGEKFEHYRNIETLVEYILVSQRHICLERYSRQDDGRWMLQDYTSAESVMQLDTIECAVPISDVYHKVSLRDERKTEQQAEGQ